MPRHPLLQSALLAMLACGAQAFASSVPSTPPPTGETVPGPEAKPPARGHQDWQRYFQSGLAGTLTEGHAPLPLLSLEDLTLALRETGDAAARLLAAQSAVIAAGMDKGSPAILEASETLIQDLLAVRGSLALSLAQREILLRLEGGYRELLAFKGSSLPEARSLAERHILHMAIYGMSVRLSEEWDSMLLAHPWAAWRNEVIRTSPGIAPNRPGPVKISLVGRTGSGPQVIAEAMIKIPMNRAWVQMRLDKVDLQAIMRFDTLAWLTDQEAVLGLAASGEGEAARDPAPIEDELAKLAAEVRNSIHTEMAFLPPIRTDLAPESKEEKKGGVDKLAQIREKQRLQAEKAAKKAAEREQQRKAEQARLLELNRIEREKQAEKKAKRLEQEKQRAEANLKAKAEKSRLRAEAAHRQEQAATLEAGRKQEAARAQEQRIAAQRAQKDQEEARLRAEREVLERQILAEVAARNLERTREAEAQFAAAKTRRTDPPVAPGKPRNPPPGFPPLPVEPRPVSGQAEGESKRQAPGQEAADCEAMYLKAVEEGLADDLVKVFTDLGKGRLLSPGQKAEALRKAAAHPEVRDLLNSLIAPKGEHK
jgi:hypothetical protein